MEHRAVAAEQEAKSSRNDADLAGKISAILDFVFCEGNKSGWVMGELNDQESEQSRGIHRCMEQSAARFRKVFEGTAEPSKF